MRILPVLPSPSPIPLQRLDPARSNIRASTSSDVPQDAPSPIYNSRLIQHLTPKPHLVATHALKESVPAFSDALALLRVWAYQRGYGVGDRLCVRGFEGRGTWWAGLLECLVLGEEGAQSGGFSGFSKKDERRPLGKGLSSYQLFKASLDFLGMILSCVDQSRCSLSVSTARLCSGTRIHQDQGRTSSMFTASQPWLSLTALRGSFHLRTMRRTRRSWWTRHHTSIYSLACR